MPRQIRLIISPGVLFKLRMSLDIRIRERFHRAGRFEGVFGCLRDPYRRHPLQAIPKTSLTVFR